MQRIGIDTHFGKLLGKKMPLTWFINVKAIESKEYFVL